ncbi:hypothetical protein BDZ45DRAFT_791674 [Acephala macrosclerotiorum]|nr:hypothetical protein BDZ45DRAFT_791674 [Acephala macrosclerotiorum]
MPPAVANGASFTFPVTFNLTDANLLAYENSNNAPMVPGDFLSMLNLFATDSTGTVSDITIPLSGTVVAIGGYLVLNQTTVDLGAAVVNGPTISRSITLSNDGAAPLTFSGFAYQDFYGSMSFVNVTSTTVGNGYTYPSFPAVGSKI